CTYHLSATERAACRASWPREGPPSAEQRLPPGRRRWTGSVMRPSGWHRSSAATSRPATPPTSTGSPPASSPTPSTTSRLELGGYDYAGAGYATAPPPGER